MKAAWGYPEDDVQVIFSTVTIRNVLGETREGRMDSTGQLDCPFCRCVSQGEQCRNPACEAEPHANPEQVLARRAEHEERLREDAERQARHERIMESTRRYNDERVVEIAAIRESGYCVRCFVRSGNRKRVRHRSVDYHEAQR